VLSVVAPMLLDILRYQWDVRSERQGRRMRDAVQELLRHTADEGETGERLRQQLDAAVVTRLKQAVDDGVDVRRTDNIVRETMSAVRREAVRTVKLFWTMSLWIGVVHDVRLDEMMTAQRNRAMHVMQSLEISAVSGVTQAVMRRTALLRM